MFAFLLYPIPRLLPLFCALDLGGYRRNLDFLRGCGEISIERELVIGVYVSTWRVLLQDLELPRSQRLKMPLELGLFNLCCFFDVLFDQSVRCSVSGKATC